jgi:hypothetical protein
VDDQVLEIAVLVPLEGCFDRGNLGVKRHLFPRESLGALVNDEAGALEFLTEVVSEVVQAENGIKESRFSSVSRAFPKRYADVVLEYCLDTHKLVS